MRIQIALRDSRTYFDKPQKNIHLTIETGGFKGIQLYAGLGGLGASSDDVVHISNRQMCNRNLVPTFLDLLVGTHAFRLLTMNSGKENFHFQYLIPFDGNTNSYYKGPELDIPGATLDIVREAFFSVGTDIEPFLVGGIPETIHDEEAYAEI